MSARKWITCGAHGRTPPTFACQHVTRGIACGYHASSDDPDDKWPDAWCDLCEEAFQAQGGEWNDVSQAQASIKVMCTHCYEAARARNVDVPAFARGSGARLTDGQTAELIHHAIHAGQDAERPSDRRWGWRAMKRWDFDHEASTLTFSDPTSPSVIADVRLVGSYSTKSGTFQWAWETLDEGAAEAAAVSRLRVFGEVRGIATLTTPNFACDEAEAWGLTSLAGYILGAEGLYRAPFDHQRWFMLLSNWRAVH